ncbi:MAG: DUF6538 domain-containing protein [Gammaproteobacteria bacterium]
MPLAAHLIRRGAVYYWRRRIPSRLAACWQRPHVQLSLNTADPNHACTLGAQLDAALAEIVMLAARSILSRPKIDAMMRAIVAAHSAKLDRLAAAAKMDAGFDAGDAERTDLYFGWACRLLDSQGSGAVVRPQGREVMMKAGFSETDDEEDHRRAAGSAQRRPLENPLAIPSSRLVG